jgi:MFS family permease
MTDVLKGAWALFFGLFLLMLANGLQGTLLGVRGAIEGFSTLEMSFVMSAYFIGFLGGSQLAPAMIRRVGHVRVFAALASLISAGLLLYAVAPDPVVWTAMRVLIGFCYSAVYVTAESWLNNASTNENRGQTLSFYMIVQMGGIVAAQGLMNVGDPAGFILFVIPSVLVSISFAPILLSISPAPFFERAKPMTLRRLFQVSPLGFVGSFLLGGLFAAQFGMSAVWGTEAGLNVARISLFVSTMFAGGLVMQYPVGWISDRMDRRVLIAGLAGLGGVVTLIPALVPAPWPMLLVAGFTIGAVTNPLYSLVLAYTNDYLDADDMAAASGGLIFLNGLGASAGPIGIGWLMGWAGPDAYFGFVAVLLFIFSAYALYRMTQRATPDIEETGAYAPVFATASPVAFELTQEATIEADRELAENAACAAVDEASGK